MAIHIEDEYLKVLAVQRQKGQKRVLMCGFGDSTKLDEQVLVSLNIVFDRGQRVG